MSNISRLARRTVSRLVPRIVPRVACSGCGRLNGPDVRLISGPGVYFCADCFATASAQIAPRRPPSDAIRCRFCRQSRGPADVAVVGTVPVCADCLGTMEVVFDAANVHNDSR